MAEVLIRSSGGEWRAPVGRTLSSEDELQRLLADSPELLPGPSDVPLVAIREFPVDVGYIDVVAVGSDGSLVVVECKLRANPEIRRQVMGQVLAYAAFLWELTFERFEAAFESRNEKLLASSAFEELPDWDPHEFRRSLASNLNDGALRVVVAVDEITDELKRTIQYLNRHTTDELEVVALELGYVKDGDVEMIVPRVFGEEAVARKRESRTRRWDEMQFWEHAQEVASPEVIEAMESLKAWADELGADFYWGEGKHHPSMTAWTDIEAEPTPVWTCYLSDSGASLGLNFEWISRRVSNAGVEVLAQELRKLPRAAALLKDLEKREYRIRPSLPFDPLVSEDRDTVKRLISAYQALVDWDQAQLAKSSDGNL